MANDKNKTAYIGIEREENSVKYIAKVFDKSPFQITKMQYNAIVKALSAQNWAMTEEDEVSVISRIISNNVETPGSD
jgi:tRNA G46 methylase TrmB